MKQIAGVLAIAVTISASPVLAQTQQPSPAAPSAQNSGAGIQGYPGNKNGPAANKGTVGSSSAVHQDNPNAMQQDSAKLKGLEGNTSGPSPKKSGGSGQ